jgi:hypothetical protein
MFEIVCELANTSGKTLTIETSIPEAEKPDVQILKNGHQLGVFASQTRSTVKITVVSVENADRIEKLEAALRDIEVWVNAPPSAYSMMALDGLFSIAREAIAKALEEKDE